jgi:hypothetical protein
MHILSFMLFAARAAWVCSIVSQEQAVVDTAVVVVTPPAVVAGAVISGAVVGCAVVRVVVVVEPGNASLSPE